MSWIEDLLEASDVVVELWHAPAEGWYALASVGRNPGRGAETSGPCRSARRAVEEAVAKVRGDEAPLPRRREPNLVQAIVEVNQRAVALRALGTTYAEIGRALGISTSLAYRLCKQAPAEPPKIEP